MYKLYIIIRNRIVNLVMTHKESKMGFIYIYKRGERGTARGTFLFLRDKGVSSRGTFATNIAILPLLTIVERYHKWSDTVPNAGTRMFTHTHARSKEEERGYEGRALER